MNIDQFLHLLQEDGFPEPLEVEQIPNGCLGVHKHSFAVKALVTEGWIEIVIDGIGKTYKAGEMFQLSFEQGHSESYGPNGVKYLASRKQ